jgi:hypothetical protein
MNDQSQLSLGQWHGKSLRHAKPTDKDIGCGGHIGSLMEGRSLLRFDVMSTGKLLSPHVYFQIEMEN